MMMLSGRFCLSSPLLQPSTRVPTAHCPLPRTSYRHDRDSRRALLRKAGEGSPDGPDINDLAAMLSREAAKMRASMDSEDLDSPDQGMEEIVSTNIARTLSQPMSQEMEELLLAQIGDGGFTPDDFEILQRLGRISVQDAGDLGNSRTAVIAYAARYIARIAYSRPLTTLIKEYLPIAKSIAMNELLLLQHLCGIPEDKYTAASSRPARSPPVVPLLGYFSSTPSLDASEEGGVSEEDDSLWLVYQWEGLRPLALYQQAGQPKAVPVLFRSKESVEEEAWEGRRRMLRAIASGLMSAIEFIHSADTVHGSLSTGSILLNASEDCPPDELIIKLDGFGFGKWFAHSPSRAMQSLGGEGGPLSAMTARMAGMGLTEAGNLDALEEGKRADLQAAALTLAETFAAGLARSSSGMMSRTSLQSLLFNVFHDDMAAFRGFCLQDEDGRYQDLVEFMDDLEGAGWDFIQKLMKGTSSALEMQTHPFLMVVRSGSAKWRL